MAEHPAFTMAAICVTGGLIGYTKGKSLPSLIAGAGIGALFGIAGYRIRSNLEYGNDMALGTSLFLLGAMGPKALRKRAPVPIAMSFLGIASSVYYAKKAYEDRYGV